MFISVLARRLKSRARHTTTSVDTWVADGRPRASTRSRDEFDFSTADNLWPGAGPARGACSSWPARVRRSGGIGKWARWARPSRDPAMRISSSARCPRRTSSDSYVSGMDIRVSGEGDVGARNAYHVVGRGWGVAVCLLDARRRAARWRWHYTTAHLVSRLGGATVIAGHGFPIWLRLVGGKGVATASGFGIALFLRPQSSVAPSAAPVRGDTPLPPDPRRGDGRRLAPAMLLVRALTLGIVVGLFALTGVKARSMSRACERSRRPPAGSSAGGTT